MNASKRYNQVTNKDIAETARDIMTTYGPIQPLKIPDAVVALAQAAAKANGETEKYLPGWPLFSPPKVQLEKCTKCSREFCSSINFRRHTRVHRRTLKIDKDFPKNRDHVAAFWDKLTVDEAKTILSLSDVVVEGVTGSSILTALTTWMCKPGYASLPVAYARAGSELLDLIQTKAPMQLRVLSNELFSVLDEASENTFLCTNTAACIQKFLFDGEADKVAAELKNVVACASYMLEQKLVEAWSADKAIEALRCQKLLVEEEEAAQKRQAELMERKRMKKLRQKEQRLKDLKDEDVTIHLSEIMDDETDSLGIQSLKAISDAGHYEQEDSQYFEFPTQDDNCFNVDQSKEDVSCDLGHGMSTGDILRQQVISRCHIGRTENLAQNSSVSGLAVASKHPARHSNYRDPNACTVLNRNKTWEWKVRAEIEEQGPKHELDMDDRHNMVLGKNSHVLIGSISVAIEDGSERSQDLWHFKHDPTPPSSKIINHSVIKVAQPISHEENGNEGMFSSKEVTTFLSQRWKDAIAADHVKLVLCPEKLDCLSLTADNKTCLASTFPCRFEVYVRVQDLTLLFIFKTKFYFKDEMKLVFCSVLSCPVLSWFHDAEEKSHLPLRATPSIHGDASSALVGPKSKMKQPRVGLFLPLEESRGKMMTSWLLGRRGPSGFSWSSTAEDVTAGISAAGLTAIVTGASSGIGAETARTLALRGAHVVMAVRSVAAAQALRDSVLAQAPEAKLDVMELDLSSMASVRTFASEFVSRGLPLNILINNAGVMAIPFALSKDGIEMQFATNHVGHFLLTHLLLDTMKKTSRGSSVEGRIVNVSSEGHRFAYREGIRFEKINDESVYSSIGAYGQSKLGNILHANELARRFKEEGVNITANSLHPGSIITNLLRHHSILDVLHRTLGKLVLKNAQQGAATTCYVALHPEVKGVSGKYFCDSNLYEPSDKAKDMDLAKKLWDFSVELIT
ncbi:uncharacterized protein LOC133897074 [Phragmites australis]|uniref:uncharacterized protein LOC133897074 n=1 Tax=Phragmites australis TaxID=29695 RepID=UPI002D799185|nr:uncharacterized protein LOC133897074 [Phragmites australis]